MKITATSVYGGPNIYALFPMIRHTLDLGVLEDWPTGRLGAAFVDRLLEAAELAVAVSIETRNTSHPAPLSIRPTSIPSPQTRPLRSAKAYCTHRRSTSIPADSKARMEVLFKFLPVQKAARAPYTPFAARLV